MGAVLTDRYKQGCHRLCPINVQFQGNHTCAYPASMASANTDVHAVALPSARLCPCHANDRQHGYLKVPSAGAEGIHRKYTPKTLQSRLSIKETKKMSELKPKGEHRKVLEFRETLLYYVTRNSAES